MRAGVAGVLLPPPEPDPEVEVEVGAPEVLLVPPIPPAPAPPTPLLPDADDCSVPEDEGIVISVVCDPRLPVNEPEELGGWVIDLVLASSEARDADSSASSAVLTVVVGDVIVNVALEVTEDVVDKIEVLFVCAEGPPVWEPRVADEPRVAGEEVK